MNMLLNSSNILLKHSNVAEICKPVDEKYEHIAEIHGYITEIFIAEKCDDITEKSEKYEHVAQKVNNVDILVQKSKQFALIRESCVMFSEVGLIILGQFLNKT